MCVSVMHPAERVLKSVQIALLQVIAIECMCVSVICPVERVLKSVQIALLLIILHSSACVFNTSDRVGVKVCVNCATSDHCN